jgi:FkbM family methyltransferase
MKVSLLSKSSWHNAVMAAKRFRYGTRGEPIEYHGHKLRYVPGTRPVRLKYVDSDDIVVRNDARQLQFFLERVKPGQFVLDIGGNVGQYAVLFGSLVGQSGRVITFEPDSQHRRTLERNLELNGLLDHVVVEAVALSDTNGEHAFFSRNDQMSSLVKTGLGSNADAQDVKKHSVTTRRLDDYLMENKLPLPEWVKLDTEGAEINILRAAEQLLESDATVVCELHPYAWSEFNTSYDELLEIVKNSDRQIRYLDPAYKIEDGPLHGAAIIFRTGSLHG